MAATRQEAETMERRLRPVYDAIDNGQNKKAIQLVEKVLKKTPNLHCARALKGLALLRLGRPDDAATMVDGVIDAMPGDTATLQAVTMYCRELGDYQKMVDLYEASAKNYPTNEEILTQLFMAYVRVGDYQKQQQTAVSLHKNYPHSGPYYCWRVMSILMQAHESPDSKIVQVMYLPLAERLMEKYVEEKKVEAEAEVRLYMIVLDKLEKHEKVLEVLRGELGKKLRNPDEHLMCELQCLSRLGRWREIAEKVLMALNGDMDNWNLLKLFITARIKTALNLREKEESSIRINGTTEEEESSKVVENSEASWVKLVMDTERDLVNLWPESLARPLRGPLLARLELLAQIDRHKLDPTFDSSPSKLLTNYFKTFSSRGSCFTDMKPYLCLISPEAFQAVLHSLNQILGKEQVNFSCDDDQVKENADRLRKYISLVQLQRYSGSHSSLSVEEKRALVADCRTKFEDSLRFGLTLTATVNQPGDFFMQLAAHLMMEIYRDTDDPEVLWEAVVMLETGRKHTQTNPQLSLLLLKLYAHLGVAESCTRLFNSLAIKHIQLDTIGYLVTSCIQHVGAFGFAGQLLTLALRFYLGVPKDTSEYTTNAYKNGVFHKIEEMVDLRERLQHSHGFLGVCIDKLMLDFLMQVTSLTKAEDFFSEKYQTGLPFTHLEVMLARCALLQDNRDLRTFEDWSPENEFLQDDEIRLSFEFECLWLKIQLLILQNMRDMFVLVMSMSSANHSVKFSDTPESLLNSRLKELEDVLQEAKNHECLAILQRKKSLLLPVQSPPPSPLYLFLKEGFGDLMVRMISLMDRVLLTPPSLCPSVEAEFKEMADKLGVMASRIRGIPEELSSVLMSAPLPSSEDIPGDNIPVASHPFKQLLKIKIDLEAYVMLITVTSMIVLMCAICAEHLSPRRVKRRKKKGKATPSRNGSQMAATKALGDFLKSVKSQLMEVATQFRTLPSVDEGLVPRLGQLFVTDVAAAGTDYEKQTARVTAEVCCAVMESYSMSFRDCAEVVTGKVSFIADIIEQLGGDSSSNPSEDAAAS